MPDDKINNAEQNINEPCADGAREKGFEEFSEFFGRYKAETDAKIAKLEEEIERLKEELAENGITDDPVAKERARIRYFADHEEASRVQEAIEKGRAEGRAEIEAERAAITKALRDSGFSEEQINYILND